VTFFSLWSLVQRPKAGKGMPQRLTKLKAVGAGGPEAEGWRGNARTHVHGYDGSRVQLGAPELGASCFKKIPAGAAPTHPRARLRYATRPLQKGKRAKANISTAKAEIGSQAPRMRVRDALPHPSIQRLRGPVRLRVVRLAYFNAGRATSATLRTSGGSGRARLARSRNRRARREISSDRA
jgi:hypothetical protein